MVRSAIFLSIIYYVILTVCGRPNDYDIDTERVSGISNRLGDALFPRLGEDDENVIYSPSSISIALSALYVGTRGTTRQELGRLGYKELEDQGYSVPTSYQQLLEGLQADSDAYNLDVANALIYQSGYPVLDEYKDTLEASYNALLEEVDFSGDREGAVKEVNDWVSEKTHGKIPTLVEDLDQSTRLLLLNAVYFKGTWKTEFDEKNTKQRPFHNNGVDYATPVAMMMGKSKYSYLHDEDRRLSAIELPYKGEDISMVVLLPEETDGVWRLQNQVSYDDLYDIIDHLEEKEVTVYLPKFKFGYYRSLKKHIKSMGVHSVFGPDADLSGITGSNELFVSDVVHKAVVEVNEEGSEAAAVTGVVVALKSGLVQETVFNVDHPFVFYIIDKRTKTNLFVGRVTEL